MDARGSSGDGCQHDLGRGNDEIVAVMFAQADEINPDLVGQNRLIHHIPQNLIHRCGPTVRLAGHIAECVEAKETSWGITHLLSPEHGRRDRSP